MAFVVDGCERLINGDDYKFVSKHRSPYHKGSTWTISFSSELSAANDSIHNNYIESKANGSSQIIGYNLIPNYGKYLVVGYDCHYDDLILCKFVNSSPCLWHGYPADYRQNIQDKPTQVTLRKMLNNNLIDKRTMSRISRGQR